MKKIIILCVICLFVCMGLQRAFANDKITDMNNKVINNSSDGNIIIVDNEGDGDFIKIQNAIDNATVGDTIEVYSGTYVEDVLINKSLNLYGIEYEMGRKSGEKRYGPRPIDIDILYFGDKEIRSDILKVPHPLIRERKFVLVPLGEIAPEIEIEEMNIKAYLEKKQLPGRVEKVS